MEDWITKKWEFGKIMEDMSEDKLKERIEEAFNWKMPELRPIPYIGIIDQTITYKYPELTALCVSGDTLIDVPRDILKYPNGIPIKNLIGKEGLVYSFDTNSKQYVLKRFYSVRKTQKNVMTYKLTYRLPNTGEEKELFATGDHTILTTSNEFKKLKNLKPGEKLRSFHRKIYSSIIQNGTEIPEHRFIGSEMFNKNENNVIHHNNHKPYDNTITNLKNMSIAEHVSHHKTNLYNYKSKITKEILKTMYDNEKYSIQEISRIFSCDPGTVKNYLKKYNFKIRSREEQMEYMRRGKHGGFEKINNINNNISTGNFGAEVIKIEKHIKQDVYNMEVEDTECYVSNGIVLHNCPVTGIQDLYTITIKFVPDKSIPELKSLKMNYLGYRNLPISHEHLQAKIYKEFKEQIKPKSLKVELDVTVRGGIYTNIQYGNMD